MRILALSDTHRNIHNTKDILERLKNSVEIVVHLGDCYDDMDYFKRKYKELKFYCVIGNCDFLSTADHEACFFVNGRKVLLTHGHNQGVKYGYETLLNYAKEKEADICL